MRFLAYDVETANHDVGSICAIGWVCVEDDAVLESGYSLIDPQASFSAYNTKVHGIRRKDVQGAPTFGQYWESTLAQYMTTSVVLAQNANFDISATEQALRNANIADPGIDYVDTLPIFKQFLPALPNHRLPTCAEWAGFDFHHHHALEDASAIIAIARALCDVRGYGSIAELIVRGLASQNTLTNTFQPKASKHVEPSEPSDNVLMGCKFCITGDVPCMDREQVQALIERHGGRMTGSVSRQTRFLICGTYADYPDDHISGKRRKALELLEQGAAISLLDANQFIDLMRDPMSNEFFCRYAEETQARQQQEEEKAREKEQRAAQRLARAERNEQKTNSAKPKRRVLRLNLDGSLVAEYSSVADASAACGVNVKCIRDAANGVQKTAGGCLWQFIEIAQG